MPLVITEAGQAGTVTVIAFLDVTAAALGITDEFFPLWILDAVIIVSVTSVSLERRQRELRQILEPVVIPLRMPGAGQYPCLDAIQLRQDESCLQWRHTVQVSFWHLPLYFGIGIDLELTGDDFYVVEIRPAE